MTDLVLVLRYRKAVTYGFHTLLAALEEHPTDTRYEVVFAESAQATIDAITAAGGTRTLVLWSFYSPDAAALAGELATIKAAAPGATHVAGGVHATAEPVQTLDAGWDVAAVGEGERTLLDLVDSGGDPAGITGLVYRDGTGRLVRTGKAHKAPLGTYRGSSRPRRCPTAPTARSPTSPPSRSCWPPARRASAPTAGCSSARSPARSAPST